MVVAAGILGQALRSDAEEGSNAVWNAFAENGSEPAVGDSELAGHVVVVVQEVRGAAAATVAAVVITLGALASGVSNLAGAGAAIGEAAVGVAFRVMDETIESDGAGGGEVIPVHVAVA